MRKKLRDMTEPELSRAMTRAGRLAESALPRDTLFVLLAFDPPDVGAPSGGVAQYISNARREGIILTLRESADRLERNQAVERVPFDPPTYTCPRCGAVSHNRDDVRLRYCGRCHRFDGTDEV